MQRYLTVYLDYVPLRQHAEVLRQLRVQLSEQSAAEAAGASLAKPLCAESQGAEESKIDDNERKKSASSDIKSDSLLQTVKKYQRLSEPLAPLYVQNLIEPGTYVEEIDSHIGQLVPFDSLPAFSYKLLKSERVSGLLADAVAALSKPGAVTVMKINSLAQELGEVRDCVDAYTHHDSVAELNQALNQRAYGRLFIVRGEACLCVGATCEITTHSEGRSIRWDCS